MVDKGPCPGDSGGPLLVTVNGAFVEAGVLKAASCGGGASYSEVGTGGNRDWILSQINAPHDDPPAASPDAPEDSVHRESWDLGEQCVTTDVAGQKGAFGAWGFYIPGCVARVTCPANTSCTAHTESTIFSNGEERVTLNQRASVLTGGENVWTNHASCDEAGGRCSAKDDTPTFSAGETFEVQCNGVHAREEQLAKVACMVDVTYE